MRGPNLIEGQVFIHFRVGDDLVQSERFTKIDQSVLIGAITNVVIRPVIERLHEIYTAENGRRLSREFVIYFESDSCTFRNAGLKAL